VDYTFKPGVKVVEAGSYNVGNDDHAHGQHFVIARSYSLKQEWLVSPRDVSLIGILTQEGILQHSYTGMSTTIHNTKSEIHLK